MTCGELGVNSWRPRVDAQSRLGVLVGVVAFVQLHSLHSGYKKQQMKAQT